MLDDFELGGEDDNGAYIKRNLFKVVMYYVKRTSQNRARRAFVFIKHIHFSGIVYSPLKLH